MEAELRARHKAEVESHERSKKAQAKCAQELAKQFDDFSSGLGHRMTQAIQEAQNEASQLFDKVMEGDQKYVHWFGRHQLLNNLERNYKNAMLWKLTLVLTKPCFFTSSGICL